ncbi:hypothetical protein BV22DRAFT_271930 [Leucogyrophana mollusca]|uniref:Uncharacterized protein n=1 Tax=Leucogyrophana mollusca TaxID=85980 RepID=A0ACB8BPL8_9AGAM|nr:hypothetical protein BV22DRAFT_271930 [Leucogyrophana mollusca]
MGQKTSGSSHAFPPCIAMRSFSVLLFLVVFVMAKSVMSCAYRNVPHFGQWAVDFYSDPGCRGTHKMINGTKPLGTDPECHNLGFFDCKFVGSFVFSGERIRSGGHFYYEPTIAFFEKRDCKGENFGSSDTKWINKNVTYPHRSMNSFQISLKD